MTLKLFLFEVLPNTLVNKLNEFHKKKLNIKAFITCYIYPFPNFPYILKAS